MPQDELPTSPLPGIRCIEITPEYEAALQRFFEANPRYFVSVNGEPADGGDAHEEIYGAPPAGWPFTRKWLVGYLDQNGALVAMANIVSDLLARGVWHIGLFIVATSRPGSGDAHALYRSLEAWASSHRASWLRLGVVRGNQRAESSPCVCISSASVASRAAQWHHAKWQGCLPGFSMPVRIQNYDAKGPLEAWDRFGKAFNRGDKETAMKQRTPSAQQQYGPVLDALMPRPVPQPGK